MYSLSNRIEKIILQHGTRGMDRLREHMQPGYCERAAQLILDNKGVVLIGTGFPVSGSFESDGPIGAIALYRVLEHLGYEPMFVCAPPISKILSRDFVTHELPIAAWVESRPFVRQAISELNPSLVVSVERPGVAADGRYYNMRKEDITRFAAKYDLFFESGCCPTVAFGDGGNEIGMGNLYDALAEMDIIFSVTCCDELVIATVSNWGVYGVLAVLSGRLKEDLFDLIDPEATIKYLVANGCLDGVTMRLEHSEDGFPITVGVGIINELRKLVFS
ncbi:MAG: glutamate cyclase domain-containing protein [Pseudomonadota bacterium]